MPTLKEAKTRSGLSQKALDLVENPAIDHGEKKTQLDKIETDIKSWEEQVTDLSDFEEQKKRWKELAGAADVDTDTQGRRRYHETGASRGGRRASVSSSSSTPVQEGARDGGIFKKGRLHHR
jgi:hypothetical protein